MVHVERTTPLCVLAAVFFTALHFVMLWESVEIKIKITLTELKYRLPTMPYNPGQTSHGQTGLLTNSPDLIYFRMLWLLWSREQNFWLERTRHYMTSWKPKQLVRYWHQTLSKLHRSVHVSVVQYEVWNLWVIQVQGIRQWVSQVQSSTSACKTKLGVASSFAVYRSLSSI